MSYEFKEFPKWLYAEGKPPVVVKDRDGEEALGEGWYPTPDALPKSEDAAVASGAVDPAAEKAAEESKSPWLVRANDVGLEVDRRWSVQTLKAKVLEAEAAKRA
jgi:hypothetical protein